MRLAAERLFAEARALAAQDPAAAGALLNRALAADPRHFGSLHLLGLLAGRAGDEARSVEMLSRAMATGTPDEACAAGLRLAGAQRRWNRTADAEATFRRVLAAAPGSREGWHGLGLLLGAEHRHADAAEALRRAVALDPGFAPANDALAAALFALGELDGAAAAAERGMAAAPGEPAFARRLAIVRNAQGRHGEAAALCRAGLRAGPDAGLLNTLGIALKEGGRAEDAVGCFRRALSAEPDLLDARYNLATALKDEGRTDEAVALLSDVVARAPGHAPARVALAMAHLPPFYADEAEVRRRRADYGRALDGLAAFADAHGPDVLADGIGAAQPFLLAYQGLDDVDLQRRYGVIAARAMAARHPAVPLAPPPRPGERLRLGIVSAHFRDHSVWRLPTRGWVERLDRTAFELAAYHLGPVRDAETERAEALFDRFVQGPRSLAGWRERIAADRPHALLYPEIGMDPVVAQLAAMRLAPVQCASWGHPVTSGLPTIDLFLSADAMEPAGAADHYTERLVRLPGLSTPIVVRPADRAAPSRTSLGLPEEGVLFWSGQTLSKYLPPHDRLFARIAAAVPETRFLFVASPPGGGALDARFRDRLAAAFAGHGLDADRHCLFLPRLAPDRFAQAVACADMVLDSVGWSGCNSLVEALAAARPVVTMPGATMRSRHGAAFMRAIGMGDRVCADEDGYVAAAVALARNPGERAEQSARIRAGLPRLDDPRCVPALAHRILRACAGSIGGNG